MEQNALNLFVSTVLKVFIEEIHDNMEKLLRYNVI